MKIKFNLFKDSGTLVVQKEDTDQKATASGYTRHVHGWGAEIHLLHLIRQRLMGIGLNLARVKVSSDAHLFGDDHMCYLRTPGKLATKSSRTPHMWIVDRNYAIRSSSEEYNDGKEVIFGIDGDIFNKQPNWLELLGGVCDKAGVECVVRHPVTA